MPDVFDKATRSRIMSKIRSKNTGIERILKEALLRNGLKNFEMHYSKIIGKPDFVFVKEKVAVFCDSSFWHGKKKVPQTNREYWMAKFQRNIKRDEMVTQVLTNDGWKVIRFYDDQILKDPDGCVQKIIEILRSTHPHDEKLGTEK